VTGVTVQSGWPGIGGVLVPYSQACRNDASRRCESFDASAMKSAVETDFPALRLTHARSIFSNVALPAFWRSA